MIYYILFSTSNFESRKFERVIESQNINFLNHFRSKRGNGPIKIGVDHESAGGRPIKISL